MRTLNIRIYLIAFVITAIIFGTAFYISNYLNEARIAQIREIEERISTDILSLETQFDLLAQLSCEQIEENPVLSQEISELAERLQFAENQLGVDNPQVAELKRSYTLLQIKDTILMSRVAEKCDTEPIVLHYFYSNEGDCPDCTKQGHILTRLQREYPGLRVYAFDYNLDLSALRTLATINNVRDEQPALIIENETYYGLRDVAEIERMLPELQTLIATSSATSTEEIEEE